MKIAIAEAKKAEELGEIPVGAVIVKDGEVLAAGYNRKETDNCAVFHAEINAVMKCAEKIGWRLDGCDIYVTLEPCAMCAGAMIHSRIRALYFGAYDDKTGACGSKLNLFEPGLFNHLVTVEGGHEQETCSQLLSDFFKQKRKNK